MLHTALPALALALATSAPPTGTVHTVEKNGSGDFTTVQAAVDAAVDGDIILVGAGGFSAPEIFDKELAIVARNDDATGLSHITEVRDLSKDKAVLLSGFYFNGIGTSAALQIRNCKGAVRVDASTVRGDEPGFCSGGNAARITGSKNVGLMRSTCEARGGHALTISKSTVVAWRSFFEGGNGGDAVLPDFPSDGGTGVITRNGSTFYTLYNLCQGGYGGTGFGGTPFCGHGGHGIKNENSTVFDQDSVLIGGSAGSGDSGVTCDPGSAFAGANHNDVTGLPRGLEGPRVVESGETMTLRIGGQVGELASLAISQRTRLHFDPNLEGAWMVGPLDFPLVPLGMVGAGATFVDIAAPRLMPGEQGRIVYLQIVNQDAQGNTIYVGSPISVLVLAPGV